MSLPLVVFPSKRVAGMALQSSFGVWSTSYGRRPQFYPVRYGREAWALSYATDAHCVAYAVPGWEAHPRINKEALPKIQASGQEPLLHWAIVDLDNPGHAKWTPEQIPHALGWLYEALAPVGLPRPGAYLTSGGARLVWPLLDPVPVSRAEPYLLSLLLRLRATLGDVVDTRCKDWTRLYRMPRVVRDGAPVNLPFAFEDLPPCL